jgi:hypothetical protein
MTAFANFPADSFLRVFTASRDLSDAECETLQGELQAFLGAWSAHEKAVAGALEILDGRFVVVAADESVTKLSGCSKDSLVGAMRQLGSKLGVDFITSPPIVYRSSSGIRAVDRGEFGRLAETGEVTADTPVFDTIVGTVGAFRDEGFEKPAADSWHARAWKLAAAE